MKQPCSWKWEQKYKKQGYSIIAGLDEVGRGAWAGPIVAAAYMFYTIPSDIEVYDSKALTAKQRQTLLEQLQALGVAGIGEATTLEIDKYGLQQAQYMAYRRAISRLPNVPHIILLDGHPWPDCPIEHQAVIDGDALVASIAAASIAAKQYRDTLMQTVLHPQFPQYQLDQNVGYGTAAHREALQHYGITKVHRRSYKPIQAFC
jgi:ribonuclease HII